MAARLLDDPLARIDQDHGQVGRRRARDHVARVVDVARRVSDDEAAPLGREVAIRDVDRDALLALGPQAVGQEGEVGVGVAAAPARLLDRRKLVLHDLLALEQQAADQGRLAVVNRAGRREAQQLDRAACAQ